MTKTSLGSMRVGEAIVPIESISLGRHCLMITARFPSKHEGECGPVTLYSSDGEEFSTGMTLKLEKTVGHPPLIETFEVVYQMVVSAVNGHELIQ